MTEIPKPQVPVEDNLAKDLLKILADAGLSAEQQQAVMLELTPYVVARDHKILSHGYQSGRASV